MAVFRERDKQYFPLNRIEHVVDLFKGQLERDDEPDLTLLSIVLGAVEACLTVNRGLTTSTDDGIGQNNNCAVSLPELRLATVEALYQRFAVYIKGSVDLTDYDGKYATRQLVKKVSDVVWNSLARSYHKDKAHLQSIYSLLTGNKLDCFGVALATVAACQQLGFRDVHLALSEDHAWVVYGEGGEETIEVTWHGKGLEDKRGLPISEGLAEKSWLYLNGSPVICDRHMEVAAMVSGINPAINASADSVEMARLQQSLLWYFYDKGHLNKYPLALGNLGDLEHANLTRQGLEPLHLYKQAVKSSLDNYDNKHVYPYTYLGSYYYRKGQYREAIETWAKAAAVISQYNHNREDEEIYKDFLEIANEFIPNIVKSAAEELHRANLIPTEKLPLLRDPNCYSLLLQFYDGICQWEEGSSTPVLHAVWAQHLVHTLSKFDEDARVNINVARDEGEVNDEKESDSEAEETRPKMPKWNLRRETQTERPVERRDSISGRDKVLKRTANLVDSAASATNTETPPTKRGRGRPPKKSSTKSSDSISNEVMPVTFSDSILETYSGMEGVKTGTNEAAVDDDVLSSNSNEEQIKSAIEELVSRVGSEDQSNTPPNPELAALAQACGESILNPEFLINGGEPFAVSAGEKDRFFSENPPEIEPTGGTKVSNVTNTKISEGFSDSEETSALSKDLNTEAAEGAQIVPDHVSSPSPKEDQTHMKHFEEEASHTERDENQNQRFISMSLHSAKMKGLKNILTARKLNGNAVKLQLTAQSQVYLRHSVSGNSGINMSLYKRLRRE